MKKLLLSLVAALAVLGLFAGGAQAAKMITGSDVKNGSLTGADVQDASLGFKELRPGAVTKLTSGNKGDKGDTGAQGPAGKDGKDATFGAYYSVAYYNAGDTNSGAIATVGCKATTDVAISGGVQVLGLDAGANARNTPVSSSFPGRMDWTTNAPRPNRLDGWIVQFGGNAGATSDKAPEKTKVWALCVPGASIPVEQTYTQQ